ncbi:MAG TPA: hypothetical protein VFX20_18190 [Steroidobacteraceae bacterium]|nr:hypothetical protein [Steroidobacteraceae bacterium]
MSGVLVDPIAVSWARVNPRCPLPKELGGPGGVSRPLPDLPGSLRDKPLGNDWTVQTPAAGNYPVTTGGDAELGPGKFLGRPCPHGHRVRYTSTKACVACLRAAVKRSTEKRVQAAA